MEPIIHSTAAKKLIEFSHSSPTLEQYLDAVQLFESGPFDGLTLRLSPGFGGGNIFMVDDWQTIGATAKKRAWDLAQKIGAQSSPSQHFLALFGASQMDWFSDDDWSRAEDQLRFAANLGVSNKKVVP